MSIHRALAGLFIAASAATAAAADEGSARQRAELTSGMDDLCRRTGLRRPQPAKIDRVVSGDGACGVYLDLIVDGVTRQYRATFDSQRHISRFMPEQFGFGDVGLGYDTLRDPRLRKMCLRAVQRVNQHLGWKWETGPEMQRVGSNFVVSFETVTEKEQDESGPVFLDPYVSFLITPKGTYSAAFREHDHQTSNHAMQRTAGRSAF